MQGSAVEMGRQCQPEKVAAIGGGDPHFAGQQPLQGRPHLLLALSQGVAQAAKVGIDPALTQHLGQRQLAWHIGGEGGHQLQPLHPLGMGPRHHPADPKARRQTFGKGAAEQAVTTLIPVADRLGALAAKVDLGIDIILHQRHPMAVEQCHQLRFVTIRHGVAQRVLHIAHQPARLDRHLAEGVGQQVEIDAHPRNDRDLHRLEFQPLDGLQGAIEGGGLHHHPVTGLGQHLQTEGERLHGAGGDDDLLRIDRHPVAGVTLGDGAAQRFVAGGQVGHRAKGIELAHAAGQRTPELGMGEQGRVCYRHAKGHQIPRFARLQHLEHQIVDIHRAAVVGLARGVQHELW